MFSKLRTNIYNIKRRLIVCYGPTKMHLNCLWRIFPWNGQNIGSPSGFLKVRYSLNHFCLKTKAPKIYFFVPIISFVSISYLVKRFSDHLKPVSDTIQTVCRNSYTRTERIHIHKVEKDFLYIRCFVFYKLFIVFCQRHRKHIKKSGIDNTGPCLSGPGSDRKWKYPFFSSSYQTIIS